MRREHSSRRICTLRLRKIRDSKLLGSGYWIAEEEGLDTRRGKLSYERRAVSGEQ